ncbi:MAG: type IV pilus biogenesis/stability protein PilW [Nitrosomonadales bacterium]|nr:type IV pilus biogenesis/stability protein PilW [Nitrosomonadales bacterium]
MKKTIVILFGLLALAGCGTPSGSQRNTPDQPVSQATASAKVHTALAGLYFERGQMGIALDEIAKAMQADRNYAPAYSVRGLIHMELREDKEAEEDFQQSLRLDRNDSETHNNYGWFLCQRGKAGEAIPHFMEALKNPLYETPHRAWLNAGLCSQKAGKDKDAETFLQRALQLQPELPQALLGMAELSFTHGDYFAAKRYFAGFSARTDTLTAEQLWLAIRIERKTGDRNSEASYGLQLRKRYPDARETQWLLDGK